MIEVFHYRSVCAGARALYSLSGLGRGTCLAQTGPERSAMTRMITAAVSRSWRCAAAPALAHHAPSVLGTVRITQPVMAGGKMLQPGTYEIRDTGEHATPLPGQSADAQTYVEFVANGTVVARDIAELMPGQPSVRSGRAAVRARALRVELSQGRRLPARVDDARRRAVSDPPAGRRVKRELPTSQTSNSQAECIVGVGKLGVGQCPSCRSTDRTRADAAAAGSDRAPSRACS